MAKIITLDPTNLTQGHCWVPTWPQSVNRKGSVFVEGRKAMGVGDSFFPHIPSCTVPPTTHPVQAILGSPNVFVEGVPILRDGDPLSCGDVADGGSQNVLANGGGDSGPGGNKSNRGSTGYTRGKPEIFYPVQKNVYYVIEHAFNVKKFSKGCPFEIKIQDAWTPLIEEGSNQVFKNYPGPPLTEKAGAKLPAYARKEFELPIPITNFRFESEQIEGVTIDPISGTIRGSFQAIVPRFIKLDIIAEGPSEFEFDNSRIASIILNAIPVTGNCP